MLKIAILGATSQIAQDLIRNWCNLSIPYSLYLFARRPDKVKIFMSEIGWKTTYECIDLSSLKYGGIEFNIIINFIGVGDPKLAVEYSDTIMQVTNFYDDIVLNYLLKFSACKYFFLSSGAAYGGDFKAPVNETSQAKFNINQPEKSDYYGIAKFTAEMKHRMLPHLNIIDIRVFNYFSRYQDLSARFFITDLLRSIQYNELCMVSQSPMKRDYLHPEDFYRIIDCLIQAKPSNKAVDCYSQAPIDKEILLVTLEKEFNLFWKYQDNISIYHATGFKENYYSQYFALEEFSYNPKFSSIETIKKEFNAILNIENG